MTCVACISTAGRRVAACAQTHQATFPTRHSSKVFSSSTFKTLSIQTTSCDYTEPPFPWRLSQTLIPTVRVAHGRNLKHQQSTETSDHQFFSGFRPPTELPTGCHRNRAFRPKHWALLNALSPAGVFITAGLMFTTQSLGLQNNQLLWTRSLLSEVPTSSNHKHHLGLKGKVWTRETKT